MNDNYSSGSVKLETLFSGTKFTIPPYQREYSWTTKEVRDFLDDIEYILNDQGKDHYFGTLILEKQTEEEWYGENIEVIDVIDGQQRLTTISIFVKCLAEELQEISDIIDDEEVSKDFSVSSENYITKYVEKESNNKICPQSTIKNAFSQIVVEENEESLNSSIKEFLPIKRVSESKEICKNRIISWRSEFSEEGLIKWPDEDLIDYGEKLKTIQSIVSQQFPVTVREVNDSNEAARMFKVINDRGRDLTPPDKIKSHLAYCAAQSEDISVKTLYKKFSEAVQNISMHKGMDENSVNQFFKVHWTIFTGEYGSQMRSTDDNPYTRIKTGESHCKVEREDKQLWIEEYLESLVELSSLYSELKNPDLYLDSYSNSNRHRIVVDMMSLLKDYTGEYMSLILSSAYRFGLESTEFLKILSTLESYALRYRHVMKRGSTIDKKVGRLAHSIYWSNHTEKHVNEVFNNNHSYSLYSEAESVRKTTKAITDEITEKCPDKTFKKFLDKQDVMNGTGVDNWRGFRSKTVILYILYEYEKQLRKETKSDTYLDQLPPFTKFKRNYEIEHIAPQNPRKGDKLRYHDKNKHRLGNLAAWVPSDNKGGSNKSYEQKRDSYNNSGMAMLEEISQSHSEWTTKNVKNRSTKIIEFSEERWNKDWSKNLVYDLE